MPHFRIFYFHDPLRYIQTIQLL